MCDLARMIVLGIVTELSTCILLSNYSFFLLPCLMLFIAPAPLREPLRESDQLDLLMISLPLELRVLSFTFSTLCVVLYLFVML